ncbi:hypothetical protein CSC74_16895 [Pseudoxanthomonas yeongjuensis]|uniref:ComEC/Rec2 family competence protein n=1 Tax=Pseudoxanthomonas yeongjuensis TaxID=377616 RepID=UPI001391B878|nr:hypothetical protein [Pseudoxanthomonas yeongjuensis]KAF1713771.1 hypothetical protein CSC74_16895 [Pseudoxanthomonas yeongjuensis]
MRKTISFAALLLAANAHAQDIGQPLPAWRQGELDIHHINTGRGESSLLILPDGTSLLVDMSGKTVERPPFSLPTKPDASRAPGEWVARYLQRVLPLPSGKDTARQIDYAMISHFHGDHMGAIVEDSPRSKNGYRLSGITEVAEHLRIGTVIDRGWPDYAYPAPLKNPTIDNYRSFLDWQAKHRGLKVEQFQPGRNDQLKLLHEPNAYPQFAIRNVYANGRVWTGEGTRTRPVFSREEAPGENALSIAFKLSYGAFDYFSGGDLSAQDIEVDPSLDNVEAAVAQANGKVDAMKANHHGSWDANSAPFLRLLQPRVIVVGARAEGHPAVNTYQRMTSAATWPGPRDIFITNVSAATFKTTYNIEKAASTQGHVVIRVERGGASYRVFVLDDSDEAMRVKSISGPYSSN